MAESDSPAWLTRPIVEAALEAGKIGMRHFRKNGLDIWYKSGNSPVSQADQEIDTYLRETLLAKHPDYGWLSEETEDDKKRLDSERLFIVDPIDGTRGFINGKPEWCISIAIVEKCRPVEAVLHSPAAQRTVYAMRGSGTHVAGTIPDASTKKSERPRVTGSKKLIEVIRQLPGQPLEALDFIPSLAYRLSMVATGELDAAFARPGACEWDIAAADLILEEAHCGLFDPDGNGMSYNKQKVTSPSLIASRTDRRKEILSLANSTGILQ